MSTQITQNFNPLQCKTDGKMRVIAENKLGWCNRNGEGKGCAFRGPRYGFTGAFCKIDLYKDENANTGEKKK